MSYLDRLNEHSDLMHRMADAVGADFGTALIEGRIGATGLRSMYLSCARCDGAAACADWLDAHAQGAAPAPEFCRNREALAQLRPR